MDDNDIIEIIDDIDDAISPQQTGKNDSNMDVEKKVSEAKYDPIEPGKEEIDIIEDVEPSKNKSGLVLVIILFVVLALFIVFLPKITEIIGSLHLLRIFR